jgi:hypothetical protein
MKRNAINKLSNNTQQYKTSIAVPVVIDDIISPNTLTYRYIILKKNCLIYKEIFEVRHIYNNFEITLEGYNHNEKCKYQIPSFNSSLVISKILFSLGFKSKSKYKVIIYHKNNKIDTKYFNFLIDLIKHITNTEHLISGVDYIGGIIC